MSWTPDPLLNGGNHAPRYLRTQWDEKRAQDFGPWRLGKAVDPTDGMTSVAHLSETKDTESPITHNDQHPSAPAHDQARAMDLDQPVQDTEGPDAASMVTLSTLPGTMEPDEQQIRVIRQQGYVQGLKDGMTKALLDLESERQKEREWIRHLTIEINSLLQDSSRLFAPLKKLALHIAEQLVRGELSLSGQAIERLIRGCLAEFNGQDKSVVLTMNPKDIEAIKPLLKELGSQWVTESDSALLPGSVRMRSNDALVEDLIESRLEGLAQQLIKDHQQWIKTSSNLTKFTAEPLESEPQMARWQQEIQAIDDVQEKSIDTMTPEPEDDISPSPPSSQDDDEQF